MGVQKLASQEGHAPSVLGVACHGVPQGRQVDPDLVRAPGVRPHFQESEPLFTLNNRTLVKHRPTTLALRRIRHEIPE